MLFVSLVRQGNFEIHLRFTVVRQRERVLRRGIKEPLILVNLPCSLVLPLPSSSLFPSSSWLVATPPTNATPASCSAATPFRMYVLLLLLPSPIFVVDGPTQADSESICILCGNVVDFQIEEVGRSFTNECTDNAPSGFEERRRPFTQEITTVGVFFVGSVRRL